MNRGNNAEITRNKLLKAQQKLESDLSDFDHGHGRGHGSTRPSARPSSSSFSKSSSFSTMMSTSTRLDEKEKDKEKDKFKQRSHSYNTLLTNNNNHNNINATNTSMISTGSGSGSGSGTNYFNGRASPINLFAYKNNAFNSNSNYASTSTSMHNSMRNSSSMTRISTSYRPSSSSFSTVNANNTSSSSSSNERNAYERPKTSSSSSFSFNRGNNNNNGENISTVSNEIMSASSSSSEDGVKRVHVLRGSLRPSSYTNLNTSTSTNVNNTKDQRPSTVRKRHSFLNNKSKYTWKTKLSTCGSNQMHQLGLGDNTTTTASNSNSSVYISKRFKPIPPITNITNNIGVPVNIKNVTCGNNATFVISDGGDLYSWGSGALGYSSSSSSSSNSSLGKLSSSNSSSNSSSSSSPSLNSLSNSKSSKAKANTNTNWLQTSNHPKLINRITNIQSVSVGYEHTSCITKTRNDDGEGCSVVYTWGNGKDGRLGHGDESACVVPKAVNLSGVSESEGEPFVVSCGYKHTLLLISKSSSSKSSNFNFMDMYEDEDEDEDEKRAGMLLSFGSNQAGQLGIGSLIKKRLVPTFVNFNTDTDTDTDNGSDSHGVISVAAGMHHSLAVLQSREKEETTRVYAWGNAESNRLGLGTIPASSTSSTSNASMSISILKKSSKLNSRISKPTELPFFTTNSINITNVQAGATHSLSLSDTGSVYYWGDTNTHHSLNNTTEGSVNANANANAIDGLQVPCKLKLPSSKTKVKVKQITTSSQSRHSSLLTVDDSLYMWGWGEDGQLGLGFDDDVGLPRKVDFGFDGFTDDDDDDDDDVYGHTSSGGENLSVCVGIGLSHSVVLMINHNASEPNNVSVIQNENTITKSTSSLSNINKNKNKNKSNNNNNRTAASTSASASASEIKHKHLENEETNLNELLEYTRITKAHDLAERKRMEGIERSVQLKRENDKRTMERYEVRKLSVLARARAKEEVDVDVDGDGRDVRDVIDDVKREVDTILPDEDADEDDDEDEDEDDEEDNASNPKPQPQPIQQPTRAPVRFENKTKYDQIFYHADQPVHRCFVANSARRALLRSNRKNKSDNGNGNEKKIKIKTSLDDIITNQSQSQSRDGERRVRRSLVLNRVTTNGNGNGNGGVSGGILRRSNSLNVGRSGMS